LDLQISQGSVATQGEVKISITDLYKISTEISWRKNCENRCSFADVMTKKESGCFSEHGVHTYTVSQKSSHL